MVDRVYNALFLCTRNSARSILAEALLNRLGGGRFKAFSAGSHPTGQVNPLAIELLQRSGLPLEGLHSKDWNVFTRPDAPHLDFVITVCDRAANEICPTWPGQPLTANWSVEDPVGAQDERRAFALAYSVLQQRVSLFLSLPIAKLDGISLKSELDEIGHANASMTNRKTVLVLCTGNSCRSQMAESILRHELGDKVRALSAGTRPQSRVAEGAIEALKLAHLPADGLYSKDVTAVLNESIDLVVTVCDSANESCPIFPRPVRKIHLPFHDPHGEPLESFERVRDEIRARLVPAVRQNLGFT